jgi:hypothetical protein
LDQPREGIRLNQDHTHGQRIHVHSSWAYFEEREKQRLEYIVREEGPKSAEGKAMDFKKRAIPLWSPNEGQDFVILAPHKVCCVA